MTYPKYIRFLLGCLLAAIIICMAGCSSPNKNEAETDFINESRFCIVSEDVFRYSDTSTVALLTAYDTETKVMYFISVITGANGRGGITSTVMLDKDGSPLIWKGVIK